MSPPLVFYETVDKYQQHYVHCYCRGNIRTYDGIRVYFAPATFSHAFYESSNRAGRKDLFSRTRAERIDWIKTTLEHPDAQLFKGWDGKVQQYNDVRRVAVVYEVFVVVVAMSLKRSTNELKGNFITCYHADNSIDKIRQSPGWSRVECLRQLGVAP